MFSEAITPTDDTKNEEFSAKDEELEKLRRIVAGYRTIFNADQERKLLNPKSKGHWSDSTVETAIQHLTVMGGGAYEHMRQSQKKVWPESSTIRRRLSKLTFNPGIQDIFFKLTEKKVKNMTENQRQCGLYIDEMSIQPKIESDSGMGGRFIGYPTIREKPTKVILDTGDEENDYPEEIEGEDLVPQEEVLEGLSAFLAQDPVLQMRDVKEDTGEPQKKKAKSEKSTTKKKVSKHHDKDGNSLATHVMCFMLCGLQMRWKQIVCYEFTANSFDPQEVKEKIVSIIQKAKAVGLKVRSVTTDSGTQNVSV